jgi:hypothetical protein
MKNRITGLRGLFRYFVFVLLLIAACLFQTGCEEMIQSGLNDCQYKDDVKYYESRGASPKKAEQGAFENQVFNQ